MFRICIIALVASSIATHASEKPEPVHELVAELKKVVPEGWKVTINELHAHDWRYEYGPNDVNIEIWREERAIFHAPMVINPYEIPASNTSQSNPFLESTGEIVAGLGDSSREVNAGADAQKTEPADSTVDHSTDDGLIAAMAAEGYKGKSEEEFMKEMTEKQRENYLAERDGRLHPHFSFYSMEYMSPEEHARREAMDDEVLRKWTEFAKALDHIPAPGWGRGSTEPRNYVPETTDDKKLVQALADFKEANPRVWTTQDCYYKTLSFGFRDLRDHRRPESKEVDAECDAVLAKIKTLITFYEDEKKP